MGELKYILYQELRERRKYPARGYHKYIQSKLRIRSKKNEHWVLAQYNQRQALKKYPKPFNQALEILTIIVISLFLLPFRMVSGMVRGPKQVFWACKDYWGQHIANVSEKEKTKIFLERYVTS